MENTEARVYSEVNALINLMGSMYQSRLPDSVKRSINEKRDKTYTPVYRVDIPLEKQNIMVDSLAILANIQYNYLCRNDEEKREFLNELKQVDMKIEQEKRERYNPDNIFKNSKEEMERKEIVEDNVSMVEYKESILKKVMNLMKRIFHK